MSYEASKSKKQINKKTEIETMLVEILQTFRKKVYKNEIWASISPTSLLKTLANLESM